MDDRYRRLHYDPAVVSNPYWQPPPTKVVSASAASSLSHSRLKKHLPQVPKKKSKDGSSKAELFEVPYYLKAYRDKYGSVSAHSTSAIYGALRAPHCHAMYNTSDVWYASVRSLNSRPREVLYAAEHSEWREPVYDDASRDGHIKAHDILRRAPCICMVRRKAPSSARPPPRCKYCTTTPSRTLNIVPLPSKRLPSLPEKAKLNSVSEEKDEHKPEPIDRMSGYKKHPNNLPKSKISKYTRETSTKECITRKSILECDVTAYDLMKKLPKSPTISDVEDSDDADDDLHDNAVAKNRPRLKKHQNKSKSGHSKIESLLHRSQKNSSGKSHKSRNENNIYNETSSVLLGGQRIFTTYQSTKSEVFEKAERQNGDLSLNGNHDDNSWRKMPASAKSVCIPEPDYDYSDDSEETSSYSSKFKDLKLTYSPPLVRKSSYNSSTSLENYRELSKSMSSLLSQETVIPNISIKHSYTSSPTIRTENDEAAGSDYESEKRKNSFEETPTGFINAATNIISDENAAPNCMSSELPIHSCNDNNYESFSSSDCSSNGGTISSDYPTWTSSSSGELKSILKKKRKESSTDEKDDSSIFLSDSEAKESHRKKQVQFQPSKDISIFNQPEDIDTVATAKNDDESLCWHLNDGISSSATCKTVKDCENYPTVIDHSENIYEAIGKTLKSSITGEQPGLSLVGGGDEEFRIFKGCETDVIDNDGSLENVDIPCDVTTNSITSASKRSLNDVENSSSLITKMPGLSSSLEDVRDAGRLKSEDDDRKTESRRKRTTLPKRRFSDLHLHTLLCPTRSSLCGDGSSSEDVPLTSPPHRAHRSLPDSPSELEENAQTFCFDFVERIPKEKVIRSSRSIFYIPVEDSCRKGNSTHSKAEILDSLVLPSANNDSIQPLSDDEYLETDEAMSPALEDTDEDNLENEYENLDPIYEELSDISNSSKRLPSLESPQKSFFEGASKTDILSYLEDAKERGISERLMSEDESKTIPEEDEEDEECKIIITDNENDKERVNNTAFQKKVLLNENEEANTLKATATEITTSDANKVNRSPSAEIERNDSGVGAETSKPSRISKLLSDENEEQLCADCDHLVEPVEDELSGLFFSPLVCRKCDLRRCERKEIIIEFVDTEVKYGRDLRIVKEEFYRPMEIAGLLAKEQLFSVFLNLEELTSFNMKFSEKLEDALDIAMEQGDEDYTTVNIGKIFLETSSMLHAFETYCVKQASASVLLSNLEKEKELLRIFLRVSQMENTLLRRMNLPAFLMVPVQRVTRYPLLLCRLHKVTPIHHKDRNALKEAQQKVELHLEHINQQTKGVGGTKIWRRISNISASHRRLCNLQDIGSIKLRKMALEILKWKQDEVRFVMAGKLLFTQVADYPWNKKGRTVKFTSVHALLVALGKPNANYRPEMAANENSVLFPRNTGIRDASLVLMKEKNGRFILIREPLYLGSCVISCDSESDDVFEIQEYTSKEAYLLKGENKNETKEWLRQLKYHAKDLGTWRRRRNALANIMINGMIRP